MGVCNCSMFCCTLLYVHFSIAIILMGKRELIALLNLSSWCLVMVERLFLTVPRGCLQFVIVVFPDHTHLLFLKEIRDICDSLYPISDNNMLMQINLDSQPILNYNRRSEKEAMLEYQCRRLCFALHCERYKKLGPLPNRKRREL